jgi:hypothetical protein
MSAHPPGSTPPARHRGAPAGARASRLLIAALLVTAAALDLTRCGIVLVTAPHGPPAAGLVAAGLGAAALTLAAARGCYGHRRWAGWAAAAIGAASAPQAAATGFRALYAVPNTATAIVGILLTVAVLATAGAAQPPAPPPGNRCPWPGDPSDADDRAPGRGHPQ